MIIHKTPNMGKDDEGFDVPKTMSNLTSASGEARASSGNRTEIGTDYSQQYFTPPPTQTQPPLKKKRNLPGNPGFLFTISLLFKLLSIVCFLFWFWFVCCMSLACNYSKVYWCLVLPIVRRVLVFVVG